VLAALGILQRLTEHREAGEEASREPLLVCMGLHTGLLIIGGLGEAQGQGTAVIGDLTLTVEALQAHAEPGTLLCSDATVRLIRGAVRLEAHRPVPVPGQSAPLLA
jgi:class 3 adenylate cyclase